MKARNPISKINQLATSLSFVRCTIFVALLVLPFLSIADESGNTDAGEPADAGEIDPCDDTPVTSCQSDLGSPDEGPNNSFNPSTVLGNPISLVTGNKYQLERDYVVRGSALEFSRSYNSAHSDRSTGMGQGWSSTFGARIVKIEGDDVGYVITDSRGRSYTFDIQRDSDDDIAYYREASANSGYVWQSEDAYIWLMPDGRKLTFRGSFLVRIDYPGKKSLELFYQNSRLARVIDESDRMLQFEYSAEGLAEYSSGPYNNFNLARVRYNDGSFKKYHYENEDHANKLTGITDRLGNRYATWEYNDVGMAVSSEHANGIERVTLEYELPQGDNDVGTTYVTNSEGSVSTYRWQRIKSTGDILLLSSEGPGCVTCPPTNMRYSYTQDNRLSSSVDIAGNERFYTYDAQGRIEKIEHNNNLNAIPITLVRYEYEQNSLEPVRIFKPSINKNAEVQFSITYNSDRQPIEITESGFAPVIPSALGQLAAAYKPVSRTTRFTYTDGLLSEYDGPREDVEDITRFTYDQLGRLQRTEMPSGEIMRVNKYDEHGRAVEFQRAENPTVSIEYDEHGNVGRVTRLGQSVFYTYNAANKLVRVTNPNGKTSTLNYDEAQRLTSVVDDLGRTVELSFNSESQIQDRSFFGVNGGLINSLNYLFDAEGRIQSVTETQANDVNGSTFSKTIELEYDAFGKVSGTSNANSGATRKLVFNNLGRLLETIEPNGLSTKSEYDVHNRLIAQTDRRLNSTQYYRDDFGLVHFLDSPDTGITQFNYDTAGNRIAKRNANGERTTYRWDAANRLVEQQDPDGTTLYSYHDSNGRLEETSNPHVTESYTYTLLSQLQTHTRHIDGHTFTTEYVYAANGKISNKILPDGQSLRFHYYESGPDKGNLRAITREAMFGLVQSTLLGEIDLDWRNGQTSYLSHNGRRNEYQHLPDGNISSIAITDALRLEYEYDDNGKIVGIRQDGFDQIYGYRAGNISSANTTSGNYRYQYDVSGNRTSMTAASSYADHEVTLNYSSVAKGNRLESGLDKKSGEVSAYRYNNAGSPIRYGELAYEYNADQRPAKVFRKGEVIAEYRYNSFGERIKKISYSNNQKKITYYLYDNRTLVAEIDGETLEHRQTVYLKHTPVVHLIGNTAYAIHTDNLGTPKLLTDDNSDVVWEATHTPLGKAVIIQQDIQFHLRFPGQYADAETGTHYNYLRDYDPRTGRYLTSDPVGLEGGDNTYAYANNNVLGSLDVLGLSSELVGLPRNASNDQGEFDPFSLESANAGVPNPNDIPEDLTNIGVTDPNQLVDGFIVAGSPCNSASDLESFNDGIHDLLDYNDNTGNPYLLINGEIDDVSSPARTPYGRTPERESVRIALETWDGFTDDSWLLVIP